MPKRSIFIDLDADPGSQFAPEVVAEIQRVAPSTVTNGSISEAKLAEGAVTRSKIGPKAVGPDELDDGAVGTLALNAEAVTTAKIDDDAVTGIKAGLGVVTSLDKDGNFIETKEVYLTAADYAALSVKDPNTTYYTTT